MPEPGATAKTLRGRVRAWKDGLVSRQSDRAFNVESLVYIFIFNVVLMLFVGRGFLTGVPEGTSFGGWLMALLAFVSNNVMLCLLLMMLLAPAAVLARRWWVTLVIVPAAFACLNCWVYADSVLYRVFRFHFNMWIWNVLTTPGSDDAYTIGWSTWVSASFVAALILGAELGFSLPGLTLLRKKSWLIPLRTRKALLIAVAAVFAIILLDKGVYAWGDLANRTEIMRVRRLYPLYQPCTIKRFAKKYLGIDPGARRSFRASVGSSALDYPKAELSFPRDGARPNVLIIMIEGARYDMVTPEVMPFLDRWAGENLRLVRHFSAGNASRFAVFGIMYGIYGSYWHTVLAERRGPAMVTEFRKLGYSFRVLSTADFSFPEFKSTAFVDIVDDLSDTFEPGLSRVDRVRVTIDRFLEFLGRTRGPFFTFMHLHASHQPYLYPPEHEVFRTPMKPGDLNYVKLVQAGADFDGLFRRYKNSLHYTDSEIARAIGALGERGLLDNTLVFVTGDHGEAFGEGGRQSHNSAFDRIQASTFMVARVPGVLPRKVTRLTSHLDVVPTIFTFMGCANPLSDYTQGTPLLAEEAPPFVFCASWDTAAVIDRDSITTFGTEIYESDVTVHDWDYAPLGDQKKAFAERRDMLLEVLKGMREFVR